MPKLPTSTGRRGLNLLKLGASAIRLARTDKPKVAEASRRFLAASMGQLKGLPQKFGQILSMNQSPEAEAFEALTESSEPLDLEVIEQVLTHEWKRPWREVLSHIEPVGRAASLGQVHRATLAESGEEVAVKVQYPGIAKAVEADLKLLGWLSIPLGGFGRQFNLEGYQEELLRDLEEELDYIKEAENQHQYHFLAQYQPNLVVPPIHGKLTTPRVLVSGWAEGETLEQVADNWSQKDRDQAGRVFLEHVLGFFRQGFIHADLHPGNFRFRKTTSGEVRLLLYDFGCIFRADLDTRLALLRLIRITGENLDDDPYPLFLKLGFDPAYLEPIAGRLPALCRVLFEPFFMAGHYSTSRWELGPRVSDVLGDHRWNFRVAGPPKLIFLMRMFHGLLHAMSTLGAAVNWKHLTAPILEQFASEMEQLELDETADPGRSFANVANHLHILVKRDGKTRVRLTSPMHVIDNLHEMMDEELQKQLAAQNIDLNQIASRVRRNGYRPQQVFHLKTESGGEEKEVLVWLE